LGRRNAVVDSTMDGLSWVRKQVEEADTDVLRAMVKLFVERVTGEEADAIPIREDPTGSDHHEPIGEVLLGPSAIASS
jgi:hypothetical protein